MLSPFTALIGFLLNQFHLSPKAIGDYLHQHYHLDPIETTPKKISDRIDYCKKNNLFSTPAVNAANGNMLAIPQPNVGCTHSFHQALYSKLTFLLGQGVANAFAQQMETGIPGQAPFLYPDTAPQVDIDEERNNAQLESGEALGVFNFNKDHNTHLILVVRKIAGATIEPLPAETQGFTLKIHNSVPNATVFARLQHLGQGATPLELGFRQHTVELFVSSTSPLETHANPLITWCPSDEDQQFCVIEYPYAVGEPTPVVTI